MQSNCRNDYWKRKNEEITFLADNCHYKLSKNTFHHSVENIVQEKMKIKSKMLADFFLNNWSISESNWSNFEHCPVREITKDYQTKNLSYSYQRFNLKLKENEVYSQIYDLDSLMPHFTKGFFVASGMSAISATFLALQKISLDRKLSVLLSKDSYFETIKYIHDYCPNINIIELGEKELPKDSILYLDSISARNQFFSLRLQSFSNLIAVILDSTCYEMNSKFIKAIVSKCLNEGVCCVLLRSHIKLDCIALEYARLGSIVFLLPLLLKKSAIDFQKSWLFQMHDLIAKTGTAFSPFALFPLSNSEKFMALNKTRIFWLRRNNYYAAKQIKNKLNINSRFKIKRYHHGLFFTIETPAKSLQELKTYTQAYHNCLESSGICAKLTPSFGFDFISLDNYIDMISNNSVIRIALSDYCKEDIQKFIKVTLSWLNKAYFAC